MLNITRTFPHSQRFKFLGEINPYLKAFMWTSILFLVIGTILFTFNLLAANNAVHVVNELSPKKVEAWIPPKGSAILETHIANNGMVFLQGAKIVSIEGTTITVSSSWGKMDFVWTVRTNATQYGKRHFGTTFFNAKGESITVENLQIGQIIQINGDLDTKTDSPTLTADIIRTFN